MAITIEEKIMLAKELGLTHQVTEWESMKALVDLKFHEITVEQIKKKLCSKPYKKGTEHKNRSYFPMNFFNHISLRCWMGQSGTSYCKIKHHQVPCDIYPTLDSMDIDKWSHGLPYGALLALKEAMSKGIKDFKIYFPSTENGFLKRHDPVIVGFAGRISSKPEYASSAECEFYHGWHLGKHTHDVISLPGKMVEIFSWDDGQVYE